MLPCRRHIISKTSSHSLSRTRSNLVSFLKRTFNRAPLIKPKVSVETVPPVLCNYPERVIRHRTVKSRLAVMLPRRFPRRLSVGIHRLVISFRNFLRALLFKANRKSLLIDFERILHKNLTFSTRSRFRGRK